MTKWAGKIGFSETVKTALDVYSEVITEKQYYGEVTKNTRRWDSSDNVNDNFVVSNGISVIADDYLFTHLKYMRYVIWQGIRWKIKDISVEYPRLNMSIGDIYNGPTADD